MSQDKIEERLDLSAMHLLHRVWQCAGEVFQREMADRDLTRRQYAILVVVAEKEGLSQTSLFARTGIDRSTMSNIVHRMVQKRLLQRRRIGKDKRSYAVTLTDEGWRTLRCAEPIVQRVDQRILLALRNQDRQRFLRDLKLIINKFDTRASHTRRQHRQ